MFKGSTALFTAMILGMPVAVSIHNWLTVVSAAHAASPATADALLHELYSAQPAVLQRICFLIPDMLPKGK